MGDRPEGQKTDWWLYEKVAAALVRDDIGFNAEVTPNAQLTGAISGQERQVDVLIDARWESGIKRRIVVDAKMYNRKLNIKDVESFLGLMKDCRAQRGIIVCPKGWSEAAFRRAQDAVTVKIMSIGQVNEFDWSAFEICRAGCSLPRYPEVTAGVVLWDNYVVLPTISGLLVVVGTGKCDVCRRFHVWCWNCGEKYVLDDEDEKECHFCGYKWITRIEKGETLFGKDEGAAYLYGVIDETVCGLDRMRIG